MLYNRVVKHFLSNLCKYTDIFVFPVQTKNVEAVVSGKEQPIKSSAQK